MFNQIFNKKVVVPFFQFLGIIAIFQWIVFPGLTAADTIVNVFSVIIGFFTILALFYMVKSWFTPELTDEQIKDKLESEFGPVIDKMAKAVLEKPKTKSVKPKAKPKTEKVLGEFQINNKETVRKSTIKKVK